MAVNGLELLAAGLVSIWLGSAVAKRRVITAYGSINAKTREKAEDEGLIPGWATALVLLGYLAVAVGVILGAIGVIRG